MVKGTVHSLSQWKRNSASGSADLEGAGAGDEAGVRAGASKARVRKRGRMTFQTILVFG